AHAPAEAGARHARALRPAALPRRGPPAHVGLQPGRAPAREPSGHPRLGAAARARQELPHRPRGAGRREANAAFSLAPRETEGGPRFGERTVVRIETPKLDRTARPGARR